MKQSETVSKTESLLFDFIWQNSGKSKIFYMSAEIKLRLKDESPRKMI